LGFGEYDILCIHFLRFSHLAVQRVQEETAAAERDYMILDFLKWDIKWRHRSWTKIWQFYRT